MIHPGLISITFRKLSPKEIIDLSVRAGIRGIEWGGDIHVPHGDTACAKEVSSMTVDAGLEVTSYGSYYCVGEEKKDGLPFERVMDSALALGTSVVRVWPGRIGSEEATEDDRNRIVAESYRIAELAAEANLTVTYEFHGHSLTDTPESTKRLLEEVGKDNVKTYWQVPIGVPSERCLAGLKMVLPWVTNVHVFHWDPSPEHRHLIEAGESDWKQYLKVIASTGRIHNAMIEYVKDDTPENFLKDAETLKRWIGEVERNLGVR